MLYFSPPEYFNFSIYFQPHFPAHFPEMQETDHLRIHNAEERKAGAGAEPRRTERKEEEKESD